MKNAHPKAIFFHSVLFRKNSAASRFGCRVGGLEPVLFALHRTPLEPAPSGLERRPTHRVSSLSCASDPGALRRRSAENGGLDAVLDRKARGFKLSRGGAKCPGSNPPTLLFPTPPKHFCGTKTGGTTSMFAVPFSSPQIGRMGRMGRMEDSKVGSSNPRPEAGAPNAQVRISCRSAK